MVFGADIIAGFPTETEEMFENTFNAAHDCGLTFLHVFPYSSRQGTPAARMPQVNGALRKERAKKLRELGDVLLNNHLSGLVGKTMPVLTEKNNKGRTEYFSDVSIDSDIPAGKMVMAKMDHVDGSCLISSVVG
jgi:threonylcarbamoyladenosine tRNA methylthiotransferase MtaB